MFALTSAIVLALASKALADPAPLTPPTTNVGADCVISWTPDASGEWKEVSRRWNPVIEKCPLTATRPTD